MEVHVAEALEAARREYREARIFGAALLRAGLGCGGSDTTSRPSFVSSFPPASSTRPAACRNVMRRAASRSPTVTGTAVSLAASTFVACSRRCR